MPGILRNRSGRSLQNIGVAVMFVGFILYTLGPTFVDPHGDGLWYGALSATGGILIGYGIGTSDEQ